MKTIVIEGLDRCGKDTIIQHIVSKANNVVIRHCSFPKGDTIEEKVAYQKYSLSRELRMCGEYVKCEKIEGDNPNDVYIFNRSHLGECVYGPMYRNSDPEWVYSLERECLDLDNTFLITLYASPEFIVKQDDGLSFSNNVEKKKIEIEKFKDAHDKSAIKNKLYLQVNDGDNYIDLETELQIIDKFLNI